MGDLEKETRCPYKADRRFDKKGKPTFPNIRFDIVSHKRKSVVLCERAEPEHSSPDTRTYAHLRTYIIVYDLALGYQWLGEAQHRSA